jgi:carboxypeptidase T
MPSGRLPAILAILLSATSIISSVLVGRSLMDANAAGAQLPSSGAPMSSPGNAVWVVRAYFTDRVQVDRVAGRIEPWEVHYDQGYMLLEVDSAQYLWLLDLGLRVEIDQELTASLNRPQLALPDQTSGIPGYPCYRTIEETFASAQKIADDHPHLAMWIDIGDSWKRVVFGSDSGYDMRVLRLTNDHVAGPKPKLFVISSIHAREYAPAELNTRFAEYLVSNYGVDPDVTWLLDYHEIHLLLQANPDGRERAESGLLWRKNVNNNYCTNTNNRGADLNRNFEFQWGCCGGSSTIFCDETYRGPSPVSEPETQAIQNHMRSIFPDQRDAPLSSPAPPDATGIFIDLHSYGELVLWPWGFTANLPPNSTALRTLGRKFAWFNEYSPEQSIGLYPTDGATDDFAYGDLGVAGYTFELGTAFFQSCSIFESTILPDNLPALLYAAKVARTPYQTPAGPDSLLVNVSPASVLSGSDATLTATIDDTRYANGESIQSIAAAEYYVDIPPWVTGATPIAFDMAPVDGSFDETTEVVSASFDTSGLGAGRHILFVRGRDAAGSWGPFSATFLRVFENPNFLPLLMR